MSNPKNLDFFKSVIIKIALANGVPLEELRDGWNSETDTHAWSSDYRNSLEERVQKDLSWALQGFSLLEAAMDKNDMLTANWGLLEASIFLGHIAGSFEKMQQDCEKILREDKRFTWPEFPEDFKVPEHYEYVHP